MRSSDEFKAEYILIQGLYEAYDQRALSLKGLATPLLGAGIAFGLGQSRRSIIAATIAVALSLWLLEAIWKAFQYSFRKRIERLESWYRGEEEVVLPPFQIYTSWRSEWKRVYRYPNAWLPILAQPFVSLPYIVVVAVGIAGLWSLG